MTATLETRTNDTNPTPSAPSNQALPRTLCLVLTCTSFSNRRKLSHSQYEVQGDKTRTSASKKRLVSPELDAIATRDGQMRDWLQTRCLPSPLKKGTYSLPIALYQDVEDALQTYFAERDELVDRFVETYPDRYDEAVEKLDGLFNPLDYPISSHDLRAFPEKADLLKRQFTADRRYIEFGVAAQLRQIDPQLYRDEMRKAAKEWQELREGISHMLRQEMSGLVTDMLDKLTGKTDRGRQKVVRATFLPRINDWLSVITSRNVVDDAHLTRLAEEMRGLLSGVDETALKKSDDCRGAIQQGFQCIASELSQMLTARPTRLIRFDDEDDELPAAA